MIKFNKQSQKNKRLEAHYCIFLILVVLTIGSIFGFYWVDSYNWNDDFEDASINTSLWTAYGYNSAGAGQGSGHFETEAGGILNLSGNVILTGTGNSASACAVARTVTNYKTGEDYKFDFEILGYHDADELSIDFVNNTNTPEAVCAGGADGSHTLSIHGFTSDVPRNNFTVILKNDNASLYYKNGTIIDSEILTTLTNGYNLQFRSWMGENSGVAILWNNWNIFDFTSKSWGVILNSPINNSEIINNYILFNSTINIFNDTLKNATIYIWNSTNNIFNQTTNTLSNYETQTTTWNITGFGGQDWKWNVYGCSNLKCEWKTSNNTFHYGYLINSQTYNTTTAETSSESFILNLTYNPLTYSIASALFNYNGTNYTTTKTTSGSNTIFTRGISVPSFATQQDVPFYWIVSLANDALTSTVQTSALNQTVSVINASVYGKPYTVPFINFTVYDEETRNLLNATFDSSIDYGISSLIKNLVYSDTTEKNSTTSFSFNPYDKSYLISGTISYGTIGYDTRLYTIPEQTVTNTTTLVKLYLLNSSDSVDYIIYVRDSSYAPAENVDVYVQRYYPGTNEWVTVNILATNADGKTTTGLVENTVDYRFLVYVGGSLVLTSTPTKIFCEATPCTITLTIPGASPFVQFGDLSNFDYSFTYSRTTEAFTYSYSDSDPTAQGGRLKVIRSSHGNSTITTICDETSTDVIKVLTCDISAYPNGTYYGYAYNIRSSGTTLVKLLTIDKVRNIVASVGLDGLIWTVFFLIGIVMIGLISPAVAVVFTIAGLIFMRMLQLASIPMISLSAIIAVGIILLWGMKK